MPATRVGPQSAAKGIVVGVRNHRNEIRFGIEQESVWVGRHKRNKYCCVICQCDPSFVFTPDISL